MVANGSDTFANSDDLKKYTLDLHVFNDRQGNGTSRGELLMDDGLGTVNAANKWCYIQFEMSREESTVKFTDVSQSFGQTTS